MTIPSIIEPFLGKTGGLLSALRAIQDQLGHVPEDAYAITAEAFNLSKAEVKGVISFYADFYDAPLEGVEVRLCAAEACQAAGGRRLKEEVSQTSTDIGAVSFVPVYCLGLCSVAPAAMVGGKLIGRASCDKVKDEIMAQQKKAGDDASA